MYAIGIQFDTIYQYTLGTAWDVGTATYSTKLKSVTTEDNDPYTIDINAAGTKIYMAGVQNATVYQYNLGTAWDVNTATYSTKSKNVSSDTTVPLGIAFSPDGTNMYVTDLVGARILHYVLG